MILRRPFLFVALLGLVVSPVRAQTAPESAPAASPSWLHEGSDIPADPAWRAGVLANGVRYAVRRNATPPGTVAIRVRIDAGALMEGEGESGWAHLLEHMVFRGTPTLPDGEARKLWERLGARFGSDTNATTSYRATTYMLDVPRNDARSLDEAVGAMADMLLNARIDPRLLDIERKVVLAERSARMTPIVRKVREATRDTMQAGLLTARRELAGTEASLAAATADGLQAFHARWYRPDRAVVVIAGDADPDALAALIEAKFGNWKPAGAPPAEPAYGSPAEPASRIALVSDPNTTAGLQLAWITPHVPGPMTASKQRADVLDRIALGVLNQRFTAVVLKGGPMLSASAGLSRARSMSDTVTLGIAVRGTRWQEALSEAYGVLNRTLADGVDAAEVEQGVAAVGESLRRSVEASRTWSSPALANTLVSDVDRGDVAATRDYYAQSFAAQRPSITPAAVTAALKTLFAPAPRLLMLSQGPVEGGTAAVAAALETARRAEGGAATAVRTVTLDMLSPPLTPGTVARERSIVEFGIDRVEFVNGVELVMKKTDFARDSIGVQVRIGRGLSDHAVNARVPDWSAPILSASGFGGATLPELARLSSGRQIGFGLGVRSDATVLTGGTNGRDLSDAMRVMLAGVTRPAIDPVAIDRFRSAFGGSVRSIMANPQSVLGAIGMSAVYGGDRRFAPLPPMKDVRETGADALLAYWTKTLGEGPVRVAVVGDFDRAAVIRAVAATFGALPPRPAAPVLAANLAIPPMPTRSPPPIPHRGDRDQAVIAVNWRTTGGLADLRTTRALSIATAIIRDRLTADFRETQGGTYTPFVGNLEQRGFDGFGALTAGAQLTPDRMADFRATLDRIVADLAANGPSEDSLVRARETAVGAAQRALAGNGYWANVVAADLDDPRQLEAIRTYVSGRRAVDAETVREVVRRYLADTAPLVIEVRPAPLPVIELRPPTPAPATPQ